MKQTLIYVNIILISVVYTFLGLSMTKLNDKYISMSNDLRRLSFNYEHLLQDDGLTLSDKNAIRKAKHIVIYGEDNNSVVIR